jgi:hypothetical protein
MRSQMITFAALMVFLTGLGQADNVWLVPHRTVPIQVDGLLDEWASVPGILIQAGTAGVQAEGIDSAADVTVRAQAVWDDENLYIALEWKDDTWDIEEVSRQNAVWVTPRQQRRDRTLFYDFVKLNLRGENYDYIIWVSPRIERRGPFLWQRLLEGPRRMETATSPPAINSREGEDSATLEMMFRWRELKLKPKKETNLLITVMVTDSDLPGKPLELKLRQLKNLQWEGWMQLRP